MNNKNNIQAVLFDKSKYGYSDCVKWLLLHGFLHFRSYRITSRFYRFRIIEPDENKYNYRIEQLGKSKIYYIFQYPK